jgi:putative endonuclease
MNVKSKYYAYVIRSEEGGRFYTGLTFDLRKRFSEHNAGKVMTTKGRGPFDLIYYEFCLNKKDARAREKYLKSGMGKRYLRNRLKRFLSLTGERVIAR